MLIQKLFNLQSLKLLLKSSQNYRKRIYNRKTDILSPSQFEPLIAYKQRLSQQQKRHFQQIVLKQLEKKDKMKSINRKQDKKSKFSNYSDLDGSNKQHLNKNHKQVSISKIKRTIIQQEKQQFDNFNSQKQIVLKTLNQNFKKINQQAQSIVKQQNLKKKMSYVDFQNCNKAISAQRFEQAKKILLKIKQNQQFINCKHLNICQTIIYNEIQGIYNNQSALKCQIVQLILQVTPIIDNTTIQWKWFQHLIEQNIEQFDCPYKLTISKFISSVYILKPQLLMYTYKSEKFFNYMQTLFGDPTRERQIYEIINNVKLSNDATYQFITKMVSHILNYRIKNRQKNVISLNKKRIEQKFIEAIQNKNLMMISFIILIASDNKSTFLTPMIVDIQRKLKLSEKEQKIINLVIEFDMLNNNTFYEFQKNNIEKAFKENNYKVFGLIKGGYMQQAYARFYHQTLLQLILQRTRANILYALKRFKLQYIEEKSLNEENYKSDINDYTIDDIKKMSFGQQIQILGAQFVKRLDAKFLLKIYHKNNIFNLRFENEVHQNPNYWDELCKRERQETIYQWIHRGFIDRVRQVQPVPEGMFNLQNYLKNQYPQREKNMKIQYQNQKQIIRLCLRIQSAIQARKTVAAEQSNHQQLYQLLIEKMSTKNKNLLKNYGLLDPKMITNDWDTFLKNYQQFKESMKKYANEQFQQQFIPQWENKKAQQIYQTKKIQDRDYEEKEMQSQLPQDLIFYHPFIEFQLSQSIVQQIFLINPQFFEEADSYVKIYNHDQQKIIEHFITWGIYNNQPMSVYMGQKMAMLIGHIIPHNSAKLVSDFLSYRKQIDPQVLKKCKQSLSLIGKIDRQQIYDFNKEYHHILHRNKLDSFMVYMARLKTKENRFRDSMLNIPLAKDRQIQQAYFYQQAKKGGL